MATIEDIQARFFDAQRVISGAVEQDGPALATASEMMIDALREGRSVLIFGNGGSAADAQHIAGELVGRFFLDRRAIKAIALTTDTSILTAVSNDLGYENIFSRQVEALGGPGDIAWALSTSGNSPNVVAGLEQARSMGMKTFAMTGQEGGRCRELADVIFRAPSKLSPRIQEAHMVGYHVICELVEAALA
ncbi:MAG: SIS domain-containing protein [Phycisphaerae bacterium]